MFFKWKHIFIILPYIPFLAFNTQSPLWGDCLLLPIISWFQGSLESLRNYRILPQILICCEWEFQWTCTWEMKDRWSSSLHLLYLLSTQNRLHMSTPFYSYHYACVHFINLFSVHMSVFTNSNSLNVFFMEPLFYCVPPSPL